MNEEKTEFDPSKMTEEEVNNWVKAADFALAKMDAEPDEKICYRDFITQAFTVLDSE
jgi:hypothetical protein